MSGTQGRFPPAMPPAAPQGAAPAWPPVAPQNNHPGHASNFGHPGQGAAQPSQFPPRFQAQPPALPGGYEPAPQPQPAAGQPQFGANPPQLPPMQAWVPQPPQPFPPPTPLAQPQPQPQRVADPAAYDLGNYGVPHTAPAPARQQPPPQQWEVPASQRTAPQPHHPAPAPSHPGHHPQAQAPGYQSGYPAAQQPQPTADQQQQDYDYEYEEEEPPRKRRWLVAAALVGSIATGGVLAYGYKSLFAPQGNDRTQIVRASKEPVKTAPANPGGRQLPNTGSASMNNRLPSEGAATAAGGEAGSTDSNGVRRVSTVAVGRESTGPVGGSGVPGMQIVPAPGGFPSPGGIAAGAPVTPPPQRQAAVPVTQVPPPPQARAEPAEPPRRQVVPARPQPAESAPTPVAAPSAAAPRPKPTGHVAVLGYRRTQMDAMRAMADVQQRYEVLRDRKLEVVQSDESSRGLGVIYRIVVGPRGSVAQAREVCTQLQQAGMPAKDCYTLAN